MTNDQKFLIFINADTHEDLKDFEKKIKIAYPDTIIISEPIRPSTRQNNFGIYYTVFRVYSARSGY